MYLVCLDAFRLICVAFVFAAVIILSERHTIMTAQISANAIISVNEDQAEAFVTSILRSAIAAQSILALVHVNDSCRDLEGQPISMYTSHFADYRALLGIFTQAAYEFYLVEPNQSNPYDPSTLLWNSCGCLSLASLCYVDTNSTMIRAPYTKGDGWLGESNASLVHPRTFVMANVSQFISSITRDAPSQWGPKILLSLDNASSEGAGTFNLTLLPHAVCLEWSTTTNRCIRALVLEVRIDALLGDTLREGAVSSNDNTYMGLFDFYRNEVVTTLLPHGVTSGEGSDVLHLALQQYKRQCSAPASGVQCPQRYIEIIGDWVYSAALMPIGDHNDLTLAFVEVTPISNYIGNLRDMQYLGIALGSGAVALVVLICLMHAFCVTAPFLSLRSFVQRLGTISAEADGEEGRHFFIPDLNQLLDALVSLKNKVQHLRRFVPQGVLDDPFDTADNGAGALGAAQEYASPHMAPDEVSCSASTTATEIPPNSLQSFDKAKLLMSKIHSQLPRVTAEVHPDSARQVSFRVADSTDAAAKRARMLMTPNRYVARSGTVLTVGISIPQNVDQEELEVLFNGVFDEVLTSVAQHGGTIEVLRPECVVACFNSEGRHSQAWTHATAAGDCALDIISSLPGHLSSLVVCAMDSGDYWVGSCGNHQRLARAVFGQRLDVCKMLVDLSNVALGSRIVLTDRTAAFLSQRTTFPVDLVGLREANSSSSVRLLVHELRDASMLHDDTLGFSKERCTYRDGFAALIDGRLLQAQALFQQIRQCAPLASHAKRLLVCCSALLDESSSLNFDHSDAMMAYIRTQTPPWDTFGAQPHPYHRTSSGPYPLFESNETELTQVTLSARASESARAQPCRLPMSSVPPATNELVHQQGNHLHFGASGNLLPTPRSGDCRSSSATMERGHFVHPPPSAPSDLASASFSVMRTMSPVRTVDSACAASSTAIDLPPRIFVDADDVCWHRSDHCFTRSATHESRLYVAISAATGGLLCLKAHRVQSVAGSSCVDLGSETVAATRRAAWLRGQLHLAVEELRATVEFQATQTHENLVHTHVVTAVDATASPDDCCAGDSIGWCLYLCDYLSLGSVLDVQKKFGYIPFSAVRRHACNILRGLGHLHAQQRCLDHEQFEEVCDVGHNSHVGPMDLLLDHTNSSAPTPVAMVVKKTTAPLIHGNLRSCNVLIGADGICKLSDYGPYFAMERYMQRLWSRLTNNSTGGSTVPPCAPTTTCPVVAYAAPELLASFLGPQASASVEVARRVVRSSPASDVFSFGVVLYEIITKKLPWYSVDASGRASCLPDVVIRNDSIALQLRVDVMQKKHQTSVPRVAVPPSSSANPCTLFVDAALIEQCVDPKAASDSGQQVTELIKSCLQINPLDRPTSSALAQHPLFLMW